MYQLRSRGITDLSFRCYSLEQMPPWPVFWMAGSFSHRPLQPLMLLFHSHVAMGKKKIIKAQRLEKWKQKAAKHGWDKRISAYRVQGDLPEIRPPREPHSAAKGEELWWLPRFSPALSSAPSSEGPSIIVQQLSNDWGASPQALSC